MAQQFFLNKLPDHQINERLASDYPQMDASAIEAVMRLLLTSKRVSSVYSAFFQRFGLSDGKFAVLAVLDERPHQPFAPSALADRIGVSRAAVTSIVDGLENTGFVERQNAANDRRMQVIQLTSLGSELLATMMPIHYQRTASLMANLTEVERTLLKALLEKLESGLTTLRET